MIADLGLALRFLDANYAEPSELLRDGTVIMRAIAEQHGGQRFRIGWSAQMIEIEMGLLTEVMTEAIRRIGGPDATAETETAISAVSQFIAQATRNSISSFRYAESMNLPNDEHPQRVADAGSAIIQPS